MTAARGHLRVVPPTAPPTPPSLEEAMASHPSALAARVLGQLADGLTTWHENPDGSVHLIFTPAAAPAARALTTWRSPR